MVMKHGKLQPPEYAKYTRFKFVIEQIIQFILDIMFQENFKVMSFDNYCISILLFQN